ncbi:erythromycin esterase family protein [Legionella micdadei]|uniref:Erythromycin esterase n=1 Tax=Legionella micdadei TaxID=451 RepID=A0A098GHL0_LEGMI|nr:erythromycin esterase family protein [Legionella micdadei]ARG96673.1 erythromycin esterase [Legionella micdadei]ARG99419.1 erythromycin esterase [Legionella micdadei]KTD26335.1 erythromycin esterase [Legionella micdadei]NSL19089.1 erythromycin esterase family protein [Legionella micdadei]CEG61954.1 erythromycin esterase [Legionella micdadei]
MHKEAYDKLINLLNNAISPLDNKYSSLLDKIGDKRFVLIGEASHGTQEFYQTRIEITKKLIEEKGFMAIAIEGDWPDAYSIHRYVQGKGVKEDWQDALCHFTRFPTWMWRNTTIAQFIQWLRDYNDSLLPSRKIGFFGLDLYSLNASIEAVIDYLMKIDPVAAQRAKSRYACFDHIEPQTYGYLANLGVKKACINEAVSVLIELQKKSFDYIQQDGLSAEEDYFFAAQNARLVKNAEMYYRSMFEGRASSWNIRDQHMMETLQKLVDHLENRFKKPAKIIIWAHNSHIGDARATEMGQQGELNIGQLVREEYDMQSYSIGFSTYSGYVTAAYDWGMPAEYKKINPGLEGSYEDLFHQLKYKNFILDLKHNEDLERFLKIPRLQRAIGVIYRPETERLSHYFFTHLTHQFDCIIHLDTTHALKPLSGISAKETADSDKLSK